MSIFFPLWFRTRKLYLCSLTGTTTPGIYCSRWLSTVPMRNLASTVWRPKPSTAHPIQAHGWPAPAGATGRMRRHHPQRPPGSCRQGPHGMLEGCRRWGEGLCQTRFQHDGTRAHRLDQDRVSCYRPLGNYKKHCNFFCNFFLLFLFFGFGRSELEARACCTSAARAELTQCCDISCLWGLT